MIVTNNLGLPESFLNAAKRGNRKPSDRFSPSQLQKSPRQYWLYKRHWENLREDASDKLWALFGQAVHSVLEAGQSDNEINEEYLTAELLGHTISGINDNFNVETGILSDWKVTSSWSYVFLDDKLPDWTFQLNVYAWLRKMQGYEVKGLENVLIFRDFSKGKSLSQNGYPAQPVVRIPIELWEGDKIEAEMISRIETLLEHSATPDQELPDCSPEQRWEKPTVYAVKKNGRKSAIKLYDTLKEAESDTRGDYVETRLGKSINCEDYCPVRFLCKKRRAVEW
jgi:hypothetical protein